MTSRSFVSMRVIRAVAVGVLLISAVVCCRAQAQPRSRATTPQPAGMFDSSSAAPAQVDVAPGAVRPRATHKDSRSAVVRKLNELRGQLSSAKTAEEKGQTKTSVEEALAEYFDHDMQQRGAELDRLTKRADDLAALLAKRSAAKDELLDLQLKAFKYDADGLGLFSEGRTGSWLQRPVSPGSVSAAPPAAPARPGWQGAPAFGNAQPLRMAPAAVDPSSGGIRWYPSGSDPLTAAIQRVNETRRKLRVAKSEKDESEATSELREALGNYFDRDLEVRRKELEDVKKGLQNMSDRLKKRADAKDEIVDLQVQLMVNEAEGLGFFNGSDAGKVRLPLER